MYISVNGKLLRQVYGCPMGEPIYVVFSDIYMCKMEFDVAVPEKPMFYKLYVDETVSGQLPPRKIAPWMIAPRTIAPEENCPRIIAPRKIGPWMVDPGLLPPPPGIIVPRTVASTIIIPKQFPPS